MPLFLTRRNYIENFIGIKTFYNKITPFFIILWNFLHVILGADAEHFYLAPVVKASLFTWAFGRALLELDLN